MHGAQATAANLYFVLFAFLHEGLLVNVGFESGFSMAVRVAYVVAAHPGFKTNFASHRWCRSPSPTTYPMASIWARLVKKY